MVEKNFKKHCDYLSKICNKADINYKHYDLGFSIYPDGYGEHTDKNYLLVMINQENDFDKIVNIKYKDCSEEELIKYLIEFKNGVINKEFCFDNVYDYRNSVEDFEYIEEKIDNIKVFILNEERNKLIYYCSIDEEEYKRIYEILKRNKIANFKNIDEEFYVSADIFEYFDLTEDLD